MLIDDPNQDAIFSASFLIELLFERVKQLTANQSSSAALGLFADVQTDVGKLRELNKASFGENPNNSKRLDLMEFEFARIFELATKDRLVLQFEERCRCCNSPFSDSEDESYCSACVDAFLPLYSEHQYGFNLHCI